MEGIKGELGSVAGGWDEIMKAHQFVENQAELLYVSDRHVNSMAGRFGELLDKKIRLEFRLRKYLFAIIECSREGQFSSEVRKIVARNVYSGYRDQLSIVSSQIAYIRRQSKLKKANIEQEQLAIVLADVEVSAEEGGLSDSLPF